MDQTEQAPETGKGSKRKFDRSRPSDRPARHAADQAARDDAAAEGHGKLRQKTAARRALREAGVPVTKAGREAAAAAEAHRADVVAKRDKK